MTGTQKDIIYKFFPGSTVVSTEPFTSQSIIATINTDNGRKRVLVTKTSIATIG